MKTKITHINTMLVGGAFIAASKIHEGVNALTHIDSKLLCLFPQADDESYINYYSSKLLTQIAKYRFKYASLKTRSFDDVEFYSTPVTNYRIEANQRIRKSDILHFHWTSNFLNYRIFFNQIQKPSVFTLHDLQLIYGGFPYRPNHDNKKAWNQIKKNERIISESIEKTNSTIVATTKWSLEQVKENPLFSSFKCALIHYGIETDLFRYTGNNSIRSEYNLSDDTKIVLLTAYNLDNNRKGIKETIATLKELKNQKLVLVTVGNARNIDIENIRVINLGYIDSKKRMCEVYNSADLFITLAKQEAFGQTTIEALCCGVPVVALPVGIAKETIVDGENGFLCPSIETKTVAKTIGLALELSWNNEAISRDAQKKFDIKLQAKNYSDLYNRLLN